MRLRKETHRELLAALTARVAVAVGRLGRALLAGGEDASRLHYVSANELFRKALTAGPEGLWANPTVGGIHSSDLGQFEIADWYVGYLPSVLR